MTWFSYVAWSVVRATGATWAFAALSLAAFSRAAFAFAALTWAACTLLTFVVAEEADAVAVRLIPVGSTTATTATRAVATRVRLLRVLRGVWCAIVSPSVREGCLLGAPTSSTFGHTHLYAPRVKESSGPRAGTFPGM